MTHHKLAQILDITHPDRKILETWGDYQAVRHGGGGENSDFDADKAWIDWLYTVHYDLYLMVEPLMELE